MKKILILFMALLLYPQQAFSNAICDIDITQEQCCAKAGLQTEAQCNATCLGTCTEGFYAGCYSCDETPTLLNLCYPTLIKCNKAITLPDEQHCEKVGNNYCIFITLDPDPEPAASATVSACPSEGTLSGDGCCCTYE